MHDADLLAVSLADLDRGGYKLNEYLSAKKDLPDSVTMSLIAADRIRLAPRPFPSDEFRARSRGRFVALVQKQANRRSGSPLQTVTRRIRGIVLGPALGPVAAVLLSASGAGAWSASLMARPNSVLYPAKIAAERLQLAVAVTPEEKAEICISIAAERLVEADAELKAGNASLAAVLLSQFDQEYSEARAMVAAQPEYVVGNPQVVQLDRRLSALRSIRDQAGALVATGTIVVANSADSVTGAIAQGTTAPGTPVGTNSLVAPSTVVASDATSSQTVRSDVAAMLDGSKRLCRILIAQAQAGDAHSALATAGSYAAVVHELSTSDNNVAETLQLERGALDAALPTATTATSGAIRLALSSLDDVLGVAESSATRSPANPMTTPQASPDFAKVRTTSPTGSDIPVRLPTPTNPGSRVGGPAATSESKMLRIFPTLPGPLVPVISAFSPRVTVEPSNKPESQHPSKAEKPNVPVSAIGGVPSVHPAIERRRKSHASVAHPVRRPTAGIAREPPQDTATGRIPATKVKKH